LVEIATIATSPGAIVGCAAARSGARHASNRTNTEEARRMLDPTSIAS
jgi:hypothetical protein